MRRAPGHACKLDVLVQSDLWRDGARTKAVLLGAIRAAAAALATKRAELAIVLTDDSAIRVLNRDWRGIDAPTNVLSFPAKRSREQPSLLGDIVLAYETVAREARQEGKPFAHHLAHLAVHGFLHLSGYDHERAEDAEVMQQLERDILRQVDVPDPYLPRPTAGRSTAHESLRKRGGKPR